MKKNNLLKKGDIVIIAAVLVLSILLIIPSFIGSDTVTAVIYVDGEDYERVELGTVKERTIALDTQLHAVIKVKGDAIYFESADCPDKLCVSSGKLTRAGETAACLPDGVVITLVGGSDTPDAITG